MTDTRSASGRKPSIVILGTRGIPAAHGGFETFAEKLAVYLVSKGWLVTVYCQESGSGAMHITDWNGVRRVHISVRKSGSLGSVIFDLKAAWHAMFERGVILTLGYNTAVFHILQRARGQLNLINMDGIEWRRDKWSHVAKAWFWINERLGCVLGNHLVADNPAIADHLATRVSRGKITTIPYGGDEVLAADGKVLEFSGLLAGGYSIIVARPEPENSFLEMISAFSEKRRGHILVVLGKFDPSINAYHKKVIDSASDEVVFLGAIYEAHIVGALRFFARYYLHGHTVGGTNPSLVEAMGAGCAVMAHDNVFNRWVAGQAAEYFNNREECSLLFDRLLSDDAALQKMKARSRARFLERFRWEEVLAEYEQLLVKWI